MSARETTAAETAATPVRRRRRRRRRRARARAPHALAASTSKSDFLELADRPAGSRRPLRRGLRLRSAFGRLLALKVVNLAVARHHFEHRHTALASRPVQLMLDPANNCHLSCPGCVHTANPELSASYDWPGGPARPPATYDPSSPSSAPSAFGAVFYNYGEPLLNKRTPAMIRPREGLPAAHLHVDQLLAADRRRGAGRLRAELPLPVDRRRHPGDLRALSARRRPRAHAGQRPQGPRGAERGGIERALHSLALPDLRAQPARGRRGDPHRRRPRRGSDLDHHAVRRRLGRPQVRVARSEREGIHLLRPGATFKGPLDDWRAGRAARSRDRTKSSRFPGRSGSRSAPLDEPSRNRSSTCPWLYQSLTLDARGRVMPCCMPPEGLHRVYGSLPGPMAPDCSTARLPNARDWPSPIAGARRVERPAVVEGRPLLCGLHREARADLHARARRAPRPAPRPRAARSRTTWSGA